MQFKLLPLFLLSLTAIIAAPFPLLGGQIEEVARVVSSEHSAALTAYEAAEHRFKAFVVEKQTAFGPNYEHYEDPEFKNVMLETLFARIQLHQVENGLPAITQAEVGKTRATLELDFELMKAFKNSPDDVVAAKSSVDSLYEAANSHSRVKEAVIKKLLAIKAFKLNRALTPGEERIVTSKLELELAKAKVHLNEPITEEVLLRQPEVFQANQEFQAAIIAEQREQAAQLVGTPNNEAATMAELEDLEQAAVLSVVQHPAAAAA